MKVFYIFSLVCSLSWLSHQKEVVQNVNTQKVTTEKRLKAAPVVAVSKPKSKLILAKDSIQQ